MTHETIISIAALVVICTALVPISILFIMNKINSNYKKNVIVDLSSLD